VPANQGIEGTAQDFVEKFYCASTRCKEQVKWEVSIVGSTHASTLTFEVDHVKE